MNQVKENSSPIRVSMASRRPIKRADGRCRSGKRLTDIERQG